jgi:long-chain acyl-CoA synthetase
VNAHKSHINHPPQNITAGTAGILSTFPADKRPTASLKDTIATDVDVNKPFGISLLLTAIYAGELWKENE